MVYLHCKKNDSYTMKRFFLFSLILLPISGIALPDDGPTYRYEGDRICLTEHTFRCQHVAKLEGQPKTGYQGCEIYGDYFLSGQDTGFLTIYDITTNGLKKKSGPFKMACWNKSNHSNVFSFGNLKYAADDPFPLLYVSQCQRQTINGMKDVVYVERISVDMKSTTLVQTICFKDRKHLFGYALQWVIDRDNNYLYGYGNTVGNSNPLNKHRIVKFRLPSLDESTDGVVYLTEEDLLENYLIEDTYAAPFMPIGQGLFIRNGRLFMPTGFGTEKAPSLLYVWNLQNRSMQNIIDLRKATKGELEDCAAYRGDLMIQSQGDVWRLHF